MTHNDLSKTVTAVVIILTFAIAYAVTMWPKQKVIEKRKPRRDIQQAYMEMFDQIYYAKEIREMDCITGLLIDFQVEYDRHESPEEIKKCVNDILNMKGDKKHELRDAKKMIAC